MSDAVVPFALRSPEHVDFRRAWAAMEELVAAEVEAECKVRDAVLAALERGDIPRARDLVLRWTEEPITDLAAGL